MNHKSVKHVAVVMDGNGRWAESQGLPRAEGHRAGVNAVKRIVRACLQKNISILSLFAFSSENWSRPQDEVDFLMDGFVEALDEGIDELYELNIRLIFSGDRTQLSPELRACIQATEERTRHNSAMLVNLALNYSGKWDIVHAAKTLAREVADGNIALDEVNETLFAQCLSTHGLPDPDLLIRTSGEQRISNFFLWQAAYAELYFTPVLWPDFTEEELVNALQWYAQRERRFGLTSKQIMEQLHV